MFLICVRIKGALCCKNGKLWNYKWTRFERKYLDVFMFVNAQPLILLHETSMLLRFKLIQKNLLIKCVYVINICLTLSLPNFTQSTLSCWKLDHSIYRPTGNLLKLNVYVSNNADFRKSSLLPESVLFTKVLYCLWQQKS